MEQIIVKFVGSIITALKLAASFIFARVMAALGLTFVTYEYVLPDIKAWILQHMTALPPKMIQLVGAVGFDVFVILILSAAVAKVGTRAFLAGVHQLERLIGNAES